MRFKKQTTTHADKHYDKGIIMDKEIRTALIYFLAGLSIGINIMAIVWKIMDAIKGC